MGDLSSQLPDDITSDDGFKQGLKLAKSLPPEHAHGLLSQIIQSGMQSNPDGTAGQDPGPAIQDMSQIAPQAQPAPEMSQMPPSGWPGMVAQRGLASGQKAPLPKPPVADFSRVDPSLGTQNEDVSKLRGMADTIQNREVQPNLSSLAAYVDSLNNGQTHFADAYKSQAPMSADQRDEQVAKLRNMAATAQNNITRDQLNAANGNNKSQMAYYKALTDQVNRANNPMGLARESGQVISAAHTINNAPNMKTYIDLQNQLGSSLNSLQKPDVSVTEAKEAFANISNAISRSNNTSDYKQKELSNPNLQEAMAKVQSYWESDPNQPAPPEVVKLLNKMGQRIFDSYDGDIAREAKRAGQEIATNSPLKSVRDTAQQTMDKYTSGSYTNELRQRFGLPKNSQGSFGEGKTQAGVVPPTGYPADKWSQLGDAAKKIVADHYASQSGQ